MPDAADDRPRWPDIADLLAPAANAALLQHTHHCNNGFEDVTD